MRADGGVGLGWSSQLALRSVAHWWPRSLLLALLIACAVTSYLATALYSRDTRRDLTPTMGMGMPDTYVGKLKDWAYVQKRFFRPPLAGISIGLADIHLVKLTDWAYTQRRLLDHPEHVEEPRVEYRYRTLVTDEPGSELEILRDDRRVASVRVCRLTTLQLPWGTADVWFVPPGTLEGFGARYVAGRAPADPDEIALPAHLAAASGLTPGDLVAYNAIDPERSEASSGDLRVSGVFVLDHPILGRTASGWLQERYGPEYATDVLARYPRVLANYPPNAYLIRLQPGTDDRGFGQWMVQRDFYDVENYWRVDPRYPVAMAWSDSAVGDSLAQAVNVGALGLTGIMLLSLSFVGVGVLTIFLLAFLDRRREIAVLKTVGFGGSDIVRTFGLEVAVVGTAGLLLGLAAAYALVTVWLGRRLPPAMVGGCVLAVLLTLAAASLLPIAMASGATVAELLGGRRVIAVFRQRVGGRGRTPPSGRDGYAGGPPSRVRGIGRPAPRRGR